MTLNDIANHTNNTSVTHAGRRAFLTALYEASPDDLYLELRCIHPTTGEVRSLWAQMGNKAERAAIFKQAERLNHEGFGLYFYIGQDLKNFGFRLVLEMPADRVDRQASRLIVVVTDLTELLGF